MLNFAFRLFMRSVRSLTMMIMLYFSLPSAEIQKRRKKIMINNKKTINDLVSVLVLVLVGSRVRDLPSSSPPPDGGWNPEQEMPVVKLPDWRFNYITCGTITGKLCSTCHKDFPCFFSHSLCLILFSGHVL